MKHDHRKMLEAIFHEVCKYSNEYGSPNDAKFFDEWKNCDACILRNIQWQVPHFHGTITRDLCFVIWHEGILVSVA